MRNLLKSVYQAAFGNPALWTALSTTVMALVTVMLYLVADQANSHTEVTQRAFVNFLGPIEGRLVSDDQKAVGLELSLQWENSGTTPAIDAEAQTNWFDWPDGLPYEYDFPDLAKLAPVSMAIGPRGKANSVAVVSPERLQRLVNRKTRFFIWGWAKYRDVFKGTPLHLTEFCLELTNVHLRPQPQFGPTQPSPVEPVAAGAGSPTGPAVQVVWTNSLCPTHNCYDRNCADYPERAK